MEIAFHYQLTNILNSH